MVPIVIMMANVPVQMGMLLATSAIVVLTDFMDFHNVLKVVIMCGLAVQVQVHAMITKEIVILMKTVSEIWFVESQIVLVLNFLPM
jgi:hypothetical protein